MQRQGNVGATDYTSLANWLTDKLIVHSELITAYERFSRFLEGWSLNGIDGNRYFLQKINLHKELSGHIRNLIYCLQHDTNCQVIPSYQLIKDSISTLSTIHLLDGLTFHSRDIDQSSKTIQASEKILFDQYNAMDSWLNTKSSTITRIEPKTPPVFFNEKTMSPAKFYPQTTFSICEPDGVEFDLDQCPKEELSPSQFHDLYNQLEEIKNNLLANGFDEKVVQHGKVLGFNLATSASASFIMEMVGYLSKKAGGSDLHANVVTTITGVAISFYAGSYLSSAAFLATKQVSRYVGLSEGASNRFALVAATGVHIADDFSASNLTNVGVNMLTTYAGSQVGRMVGFFAKKAIDKTIECVCGKEELEIKELKIL